MIRIVVFIDWIIYYYIDITQRDGSYQIVGTDFEDITVTDDGDQIIEDIAHSDWDCISCLEYWCVSAYILCCLKYL
jgi:hypothetical protein